MINGAINIREATPQDTGHIVQFQQSMAQEAEGKNLDEPLLRRGVARVFDSDDKGFYLVAEADGEVVGSLLITYEWSDWRNATFWWIQSVFVSADWRRRGVYRAMHDWVHGIADSRDDICGIRLYVDRTNHIAQQTYNSLGMAHSHYDLYEIDFVL
jgi:GNAT superfamily N-acetyltransferase